MTISIGKHTLPSQVLLAPMSGISDRPFRKIAKRFGAGLVVSEMIAGPELIRETTKTRRRVDRDPDPGTGRPGQRGDLRLRTGSRRPGGPDLRRPTHPSPAAGVEANPGKLVAWLLRFHQE